MSNWISVTDELPKKGRTVLVFNKRFEHESIRMAFRTSAGIYDAYECGCGQKLDCVTHWMELPNPPTIVQQTLSDSADATSKCLRDIRSLLDGNLPEESIEEIEDIIIRHF